MSGGALACGCGWPLPLHTGAFKLADKDHKRPVRGTYTSMVCPQCGTRHSFYDLNDPQAERVFLQRRGTVQ